MEICFETRPELVGSSGRLRCEQVRPTIHPEPVLRAGDPGDLLGAYIYGSVLRDGGIYRMWYQACLDIGDSTYVGYAESDDGIHWRKPVLNLVEVNGSRANNLCTLRGHGPGVFIDPASPPSHRYRATCCLGDTMVADGSVTVKGYYTSHSADGLNWQVDSSEPTWWSSDVINSIYHPGRGCGIAAMKFQPRVNGSTRRAVMTAELRDGQWQRTPSVALVPDGYDDTLAVAQGYVSGDYYGMGMMPAGRTGVVGFLWQLRHLLPRKGNGAGLYGDVDVTLTYQNAAGDAWLHPVGRPNFIDHRDLPDNAVNVYTASGAVEHGDQCRLYVGLVRHSHGWHLDEDWKPDARRIEQSSAEGFGSIGMVSWTRDRLFGFRADPAGTVEIDLGRRTRPCELLLNCQTHATGDVRVDVFHRRHFKRLPLSTLPFESAKPIRGDHARATVAWQSGTLIQPEQNLPLIARVHLDRATLWAWEVIER
jgi:hypothetical protein